MPTRTQRPKPQQTIEEWLGEPGKVVTRGELLGILRVERAWHLNRVWYRRLYRWLARRRA